MSSSSHKPNLFFSKSDRRRKRMVRQKLRRNSRGAVGQRNAEKDRYGDAEEPGIRQFHWNKIRNFQKIRGRRCRKYDGIFP